MQSRTCLEEIASISHQLKFFTIAELFFILHENATLSFLDVNRTKKISDGIRYRYGGNHTYEQVETVIKLLGNSYPQTLAMQNEMSLSYMSYRQLFNPTIVPFSSVCYVCKKSLDNLHTKQRSTTIYCANGSVVFGMD